MRIPTKMHFGDILPPPTEFEEGDMFFMRSDGTLYIRSGGAWVPASGGGGGTQPGSGSGSGSSTGNVVQTLFARGDLADDPILTTAQLGHYVMPSPRLSVDMENGYTALVFASLPVYTYANNQITISAHIVKSSDNGATWTLLDKRHPLSGTGGTIGYRQYLTVFGRYHSTSTESVIFGISVGNPYGPGATIRVHSVTDAGLMATIVNEG